MAVMKKASSASKTAWCNDGVLEDNDVARSARGSQRRRTRPRRGRMRPRRGVPARVGIVPRRGRSCPARAGTNLARAALGMDRRSPEVACGCWRTRPKRVWLPGAGGRGLGVAYGRWRTRLTRHPDVDVTPRRGQTQPTGAGERGESVEEVDRAATGAPSNGGGDDVSLGRGSNVRGSWRGHACLTRADRDAAPASTDDREQLVLSMRRP